MLSRFIHGFILKILTNLIEKHYGYSCWTSWAPEHRDYRTAVTWAAEFEEEMAESMARCFFAVSFQNNKIIIELCKESETIESYYGNTDGIETQIYKRQVLSINATTEDYINMLTSFIMHKDEHIYWNGERRVNSLHFLPIKQ